MGIGGALHVSSTTVVIFSVRVFKEWQAWCHCSVVKWLCSKSVMSSSMKCELLSKNLVWKLLRLSFGMGLRILGVGSEIMGGGLAMSVFGGILRCMGK